MATVLLADSLAHGIMDILHYPLLTDSGNLDLNSGSFPLYKKKMFKHA